MGDREGGWARARERLVRAPRSKRVIVAPAIFWLSTRCLLLPHSCPRLPFPVPCPASPSPHLVQATSRGCAPSPWPPSSPLSLDASAPGQLLSPRADSPRGPLSFCDFEPLPCTKATQLKVRRVHDHSHRSRGQLFCPSRLSAQMSAPLRWGFLLLCSLRIEGCQEIRVRMNNMVP